MFTKFIYALLSVSILNSSLTLAHAKETPKPKAYAVFTVAYNANGEAIGGVAGTAFFISPKKAITAFHVLQPSSFMPVLGYTFRKVFLVHEGEPAIELKSFETKYNAAKDQTVIELEKSEVPARYVYQQADANQVNGAVETEGFRAMSTGPIFTMVGSDLRVLSVPRLERMTLQGQVDRHVRVAIQAEDVKLNGVDCVQLSYQPIVGFSGGPVIAGGKVIAMNSFAEPSKREQTFAVKL